MNLSRRSLFAAVPAVALATPAEAAPQAVEPKTVQQIQLSYCWGMFEHRTVKSLGETVFAKSNGTTATYVSWSGQNIMSVVHQSPVAVPLSRWVDDGLTVSRQRMVLDRLEACLDIVMHASPWVSTKDFNSQIQDADRVCRRPPPPNPLGQSPGPELYCFSNGPVGYHLTDANDPDLHGAVVFSDRVRVVTIEGMPLAFG
jgi:hypothetical protein